MTHQLCHWCNRPINHDELVVVFVPRSRTEQGSPIDEQAWHTVCFGMIQGVAVDEE